MSLQLRRLPLAIAVLVIPTVMHAQDSTKTDEPIKDNSFLVEEAYNQDPRVVQHITTFAQSLESRTWAFSFTQEWPVASQRDQLSATIPMSRVTAPGTWGIGDVALNYRRQILGLNGERVAFAPRLSFLLPTGDVDAGRGAGSLGVQANLPVSIEISHTLVTHLNLGGTHNGGAHAASSLQSGASIVWLTTQRVNLLLETTYARTNAQSNISNMFTVSPGIRWAYNLAHDVQVVPGLAVPLSWSTTGRDRQLFTYLSVEHPF